MKHLWRGAFDFRNSAVVLYAYAYTQKQAWLVMCRRIARKHGVPVAAVMGLFDGSKNNYLITKEWEFVEDSNDERTDIDAQNKAQGTARRDHQSRNRRPQKRAGMQTMEVA